MARAEELDISIRASRGFLVGLGLLELAQVQVLVVAPELDHRPVPGSE